MRRTLVGLLAVALAVASLVAVTAYLRDEAPSTTLILAEISGDVRVTGLDHDHGPATAGQPLDAMDRVATGEASRAVLQLGSETRIRLGPTSSIQVTAVDAEGVAIELEEGALQATVRPDSGAVRLSSRGRQALLTDGDVSMGVGADGLLLLEATRGDVMLGGIVGGSLLTEGSRAVVGDGDHAEIGRIPDTLLLSVRWPDSPRTRGEVIVLPGRTEPGATVRVEGSAGTSEAIADRSGEFRVEVPLYEGPNAVRVEVTDLLGKSAEERGVLERDQSGPTFRGGVEYGP